MKWAEKFGWGIGSRFIAALLKAVKKKQRHEEIFEEAAEIHAQQFADGVDAAVFEQARDFADAFTVNPFDNHKAQWKQTRIDFLMTLITEAEK